ncbi:hypothetical protein PRK78_004294 [Emydomyces testavorans]|uniref:Uncharacterized protein n=1 Tax=Emydomyces testavorans TaxID=2070801 RepID=A0AAF0IJM4_9EURO|nr:hypothetical protein PRK78_004294 [Emydomyces testavorans]
MPLGANASGFLPRVTKCPDGSYCCDSDIKCCEKGKGIVLDGKGNIVNNSKSQASSSTSAISRQTSDSTPTASLTSFPTATPTALPSAVPNPTGLPVAAKAGIGVAVGFSLLSCVILFALYLRRRKNKADKALESKGSNDLPSDGEAWPLNGNQSTSPQEMSNSPKPQQFEMPNYSMRVELPGDTPPYPELYGSDSKPDIEKAPSRMI